MFCFSCCFYFPARCLEQCAALEFRQGARKQRTPLQVQTKERQDEVIPGGLVGVNVLPVRPAQQLLDVAKHVVEDHAHDQVRE